MATNLLLYGWNLSANGWANYYYSAAVQSGNLDVTSFFYGSSDWGNSITVDKPPLSLWVMGLSTRLLGLSPTAVVLPQVLMGVGTTLLIYLILRRCVSAVPAIFGAIVFFTTPIVTLMSRYNNPDPLMLMLMTAAAWFVLRSIETQRGRLFVVAGALLGMAFMTKQLQGMLNVPALGLAFLLFSPQPWKSRLGTAAVGASALIVTGGLWMAVVDLIPSDQRPYVGGSPSNSVLQLTLAYNGIERIAGGGTISKAMQAPSQFRPVDSDAGFFRLLNVNYNQEASWLLFAGLLAVILLAAHWWSNCKTPVLKAATLVSIVWLVTAFLLLSFMGDQIHTYYTAAIAPPLALLLGLTLEILIANRASLRTRLSGAATALTALLSSWLILSGTTGWPEWMPNAVLGVGIGAVAALIVRPPTRNMELGAATVLAASLLFAPVATSLHNVTKEFHGSNPISGMLTRNPASISHLLNSLEHNDPAWGHDVVVGRAPDPQVVEVLSDTSGCTWAAATYASQTAARLQLESGRPVMPVGGFSGSDPSPTLDRFRDSVAAGQICYFVQQEAFTEVQDPESTSAAISRWVETNFESEKLGSTTVYPLIQP
ncbi:glycosyltransferase family 39 protein [Arthrobacter sp. OV608]|uniref:ArnT family glycosyltransferase n=1 Tax=Arthrobacter sp. OV608 TaxID=1882768 RepID=UPI00148127C0|nr:glycosyltransferase family 39 protein [Arthrobacter sp. OV608]